MTSASDPAAWNTSQVQSWIGRELPQFASGFKRFAKALNGKKLVKLTDGQLTKMGFKFLVFRQKILEKLKTLRGDASSAPSSIAPSPTRPTIAPKPRKRARSTTNGTSPANPMLKLKSKVKFPTAAKPRKAIGQMSEDERFEARKNRFKKSQSQLGKRTASSALDKVMAKTIRIPSRSAYSNPSFPTSRSSYSSSSTGPAGFGAGRYTTSGLLAGASFKKKAVDLARHCEIDLSKLDEDVVFGKGSSKGAAISLDDDNDGYEEANEGVTLDTTQISTFERTKLLSGEEVECAILGPDGNPTGRWRRGVIARSYRAVDYYKIEFPGGILEKVESQFVRVNCLNVPANKRAKIQDPTELIDITRSPSGAVTMTPKDWATRPKPPPLMGIQDVTADISQILDEGLYLSSYNVTNNKDILTCLGITHILTVGSKMGAAFRERFKYRIIEVKDEPETCLGKYFKECFEFIEEPLKKNRSVLVHCAAGASRSVTVTVAYLMWKKKWSYLRAFTYCKRKRKQCCPNEGFIKQLQLFEQNMWRLDIDWDLQTRGKWDLLLIPDISIIENFVRQIDEIKESAGTLCNLKVDACFREIQSKRGNVELNIGMATPSCQNKWNDIEAKLDTLINERSAEKAVMESNPELFQVEGDVKVGGSW